ncbi:MAG: hypothetical protein LAT51_10765 [Flavobacteriaceae bacterium]|nr:hypothetical protein [Flavobacteriaceae bacterium]
MNADENHYKLHWEFFKSINPKADEHFFIELQINEFDKLIKQGLKEIDFANDVIETAEDWENDMKRKNFFFHKDYKEFLESKKDALTKIRDKQFLPMNKVFFVHYQCEDFNIGEQIFELCIHAKAKAKCFTGSEAEKIKSYAVEVEKLLTEGLVLIHWNQDRPNYGTDHINKRFKHLTGEDLNIEYRNEINLAEWLIFEFGQDYISHPRLDSLAKLNKFHGIRENEQGEVTFATNRLLLLTKIYFNALQGTLKTEINKPQPQEEETTTIGNNEKIKLHFNFFSENCPRKHTQILKDADFDKLIKWTVYYFENEFRVPEITEPIKNVKTNKTYVQLAFRYLFKQLHPNTNYPDTLFQFYSKAFKPYAGDKKANFDKVKNNDIVGTLMKIN